MSKNNDRVIKIRCGNLMYGAGVALFASTTMAAPVVLDSEQKAAAGVSTALHTSHSAPHYLQVVSDGVVIYAQRAMQTVSSRTTASALIATRGGVTVACDVAGSLKAKMADTLPRVLRLTWDGCVNLVFGRERALSGTAAITLLTDDTLTPDFVAAIRLGTGAQPFVEKVTYVHPDYTNHVTTSYSVSLRGDVSMTRPFMGIGTTTYELRGYRDEQYLFEYPNSEPPMSTGSRISADRVMVVVSTAVPDDGLIIEDDVQVQSGSLTINNSSSGAQGTTTQTFKFNGYRVRRIEDWDVLSSQNFVDGKINVSWGGQFGAGCMDGLYSFVTREPMVKDINGDTFGAGELVVNGDVVSRFFSAQNTPPQLPAPVNGMLINMRVRDVGTFNYDSASLHDALIPVGQCQF